MFGKKQQQPGNGPERFREENIGKKIAGGVSIAVVVIFALILLGGSFYSLKENEYAVITTFGDTGAEPRTKDHQWIYNRL